MDKDELKKKVKDIIFENLIQGYSESQDTAYTFIKPSKKFYSYQYFWDTCFHIYILCAVGETGLAKDCFRTQFAMQSDNGFVGHIHYWNNVMPARITDIFQNRIGLGRKLVQSHMSSLIQPPLVAQALQKIWETTKDEEYLREMLPKLKLYFDWLIKNRNFDDDGLLSIVTPFESGMDWKASYDPVVNFDHGKANKKLFWKVVGIDFRNFWRDYKYEKIKERDKFIVKDVGFNTVYIQNLRAMGKLCEDLGDDEGAREYQKRFEEVRKTMIEKMYDKNDKAFYDLYGKEDRKLKVLTATIFFPVIIEGMPEEICKDVIDAHFFNKEEFHTEYPVPSLAINDPAFDPGQSMYIWRGPTWIFNNWFMHQFFLEQDNTDEAQHLIDSITNLIEKSGFREYYNPFTGEGYGAHNFTWGGLVLDMIHRHEGYEKEKSSTGKKEKSEKKAG